MPSGRTIRNIPYTLHREPRTLQEAKSVERFVCELEEFGLNPRPRDIKKTKPSITSWDDINFTLSKRDYFRKR